MLEGSVSIYIIFQTKSSKMPGFYGTWLYIWVTRWVSYTKQEHLALNEHLGPPGYFDGLRVAHLFSFLYSPCMCLMYLVLWCDVHYVVCINPCLVRLYPHLFVLFMLFVFAVYSAVQPNIDCMSYIAGVLSRVHYPCCSSFYYFCFVLSYYVSLLSKFCFFMSVTISKLETIFGSSLPPVFL